MARKKLSDKELDEFLTKLFNNGNYKCETCEDKGLIIIKGISVPCKDCKTNKQ